MQHTLLIVEDELDVRENIEEILTVSGYKVITASNGRDAITKLLKEIPDLIISDITMPKMNGFELLEFVQRSKNLSHIPFIFLTARSSIQEVRSGMLKGADDYLTKPFKVSELLDMIEVRLKKAGIVKEQIAEMKENIALSIPHELRTPLTPIIGYSEMLIEDAPSLTCEEIIEMGKNIMSSALRLKTSVEKFILYSSLHYELNNFRRDSSIKNFTDEIEVSILQVVLEEYNYTNGIIGIETSLESARLNIAEPYYKICLKELVQNSFKFSKPNTKVKIRGKIEDNYYLLSLENHAHEFTGEQIKKIDLFNKQYDPTLPGSGLGLPIVKKIVDYFNGEVLISCDVPDKVIITVQIPVVKN